MPSVEDNQRCWSEYPWDEGGEEWSRLWGGTEALWWGSLVPRLHYYLPAETVLEIGPGFGRFTRYLKDVADRLVLVDVTARCIAACRERFRDEGHIEYVANDGMSLDSVADGSIDFAFSFDSLVHAEGDILDAYVRQLAAKLRPDGVAFLHHSNLAALVDADGTLPFENVHARGLTVSAEGLRRTAVSAGLAMIAQETVNWGARQQTDCFSLMAREAGRHARSFAVQENAAFMAEAQRLSEIARLYAPDPPAAPRSGG